jgi:hypothetical protein
MMSPSWAPTFNSLFRTSPYIPRMRPLHQQIVRASRFAQRTNPSSIPVRHFAGTRPTYESPQKSSNVSGHSAESYQKEVDSSPPADSSTYQVDDSSESVQRPHKPPSGVYSQAGVGSEEYRVMDKQAPYEAPSQGEADKKLRYGGKNQGRETSRSSEGPDGASAAGRKPEGKK